jgi:serine/threonine protein kinase
MRIPAADQACPPVTTLRQLHQGLLDEQEMADLEHHLDACPTCAKSLDQLWPPPGAKVSGTESDLDSDSLVNQLVATGNVITAPILRPPLVPGDLGRLGKYRVMEKLGEGASSVVYRGFDKVLLRPVVLKVFRPGYDSGKDGKREMMDEARIVARFSNDLIVGILDLCSDAGTFFLVLPFSNGISLEKAFESHLKKGMALADSMSLALDIVAAISHIHRQGLVHHDLKPGNVIVHMDSNGRRHARLIDLGLSCGLSSRAGTPGYRAPELDQGASPSYATDLFSLGKLLDEVRLACSFPWPKNLVRALKALMNENPHDRPTLGYVESMLQKQIAGWASYRCIALACSLLVTGALVGAGTLWAVIRLGE